MKLLVVDSNSQDFIELSNLFIPLGHQLKLAISAEEAWQGLREYAPDIVLLDTALTDSSGLDLLSQIRQNDEFKAIPAFFQTNDPSIELKVKAFELGADDYIIRPYNGADLVDRVSTLLQRTRSTQERMETSPAADTPVYVGQKIVFHSLRGGVGVSSLAANTAVILNKFWQKPTLVMDTAFFNGQVSMLFNINSKRHFGDLKTQYLNGQDSAIILEVIEQHSCGVSIIPAPRYPISMDFLTDGFWASVHTTLNTRFQYIVVDTPHDFSDPVIYQLLDAHVILLVLTPEMASLRVAVSALKTYKQLGIPEDRVRIILNNITFTPSIDVESIERALGVRVSAEIPYDSVEPLRAINIGTPFAISKPTTQISQKLEELAYAVSIESARQDAGANPTKPLQAYLARTTLRNGGPR